jgi:hypothetical protein
VETSDEILRAIYFQTKAFFEAGLPEEVIFALNPFEEELITHQIAIHSYHFIRSPVESVLENHGQKRDVRYEKSACFPL